MVLKRRANAPSGPGGLVCSWPGLWKVNRRPILARPEPIIFLSLAHPAAACSSPNL